MRTARCSLAAFVCLAFTPLLSAQTPTSDGPITKDTSVGYIDSAVPLSQFRLRYDSAYDFNRPTRAEFFYAKYGASGGPGLPIPERSIDSQELSAYIEGTVTPNFSLFTEVPVRFLNPELNDNHSGLSDITAGFKFAFWQDDASMATLFFRTFAPTGNSHLGLGTHHVSFEQGILFNRVLTEWALLEGETRIWVPVGGTDYQGSVLRYGLGVSLGRRSYEDLWITPVIEFVGWTVLGGKEGVVEPTFVETQDAAGDTIINGKFGLRFGLGQQFDMYAGYGRALTGEVWYKDVVRVEARLKF